MRIAAECASACRDHIGIICESSEQGRQVTELNEFVGHHEWVAVIATTSEQGHLLTAVSCDKRLIALELTDGEVVDCAQRSLNGHSNDVSDAPLSSDGQLCFSR